MARRQPTQRTVSQPGSMGGLMTDRGRQFFRLAKAWRRCLRRTSWPLPVSPTFRQPTYGRRHPQGLQGGVARHRKPSSAPLNGNPVTLSRWRHGFESRWGCSELTTARR